MIAQNCPGISFGALAAELAGKLSSQHPWYLSCELTCRLSTRPDEQLRL